MNTTLKRTLWSTAAVVALGAAAYAVAVTVDLHRTYASAATADGQDNAAAISRGRYIAQASDCAACHTKPGGEPFAGGYPLQTPFGEILASNITSDPTTGIGRWDFARFDRAVRHGKGSHGYLYPAMPYPAYSRLTDQDMQDLWAYVRTIPAVHQSVVENQLPFPFNQRWMLGGWNALFFHAPEQITGETGDATFARGRYLVEGPGHCAACHTAKNMFGGESAAHLQGGQLGEWFAPNLTSVPRVGLGAWTEADLAQYLKQGSNRFAVASGPMTEAVENSTQFLTDQDLMAIAHYLKSLPATAPSVASPPKQLSASEARVMAKGKLVYESQCAACHVSSGEGVRNMIPSFQASPVVNADKPDTLVRMLLQGEDGPVTQSNPTGAGMPRFDWRLSDDEAAAVLTYMRSNWGNHAPAVAPQTIRDARQRHAPD